MKQNAVNKSDAFVSKDKSAVCGVVIPETVAWNGNWAPGCEFKGNDLESVETKGEDCGRKCAANYQCTHYTWKTGTCWMKQNAVNKSDAIVIKDKTAACGVIIDEKLTWNGFWALG